MTDAIKTVILAGGVGSRLAERTDVKPKPMAANLRLLASAIYRHILRAVR